MTRTLLTTLALIGAMLTPLHKASAAGERIEPFDATSLEAIKAKNKGKPFVLSLWSTQCEPCREEMKVWQSVRRTHPDLRVILVSTDAPAERPMIRRFLQRYNPGKVEVWSFADEYSERIRYAIDPKWRGEIPRTYFFDAAHQAQGKSGIPDRAWLDGWLAQQTGRAG